VTKTDPRNKCPVCGSTETRLFAHAKDVEYCTSPEEYTYLVCGQCGSVFLENPPVNQLEKIYPSNYYSYEPATRRASPVERAKEFLDARLFRKLIKEISARDVSVLDVGGGAGWLLSLARRVSPRVKATHELDINERARAAAESAGHVFHCCRVEDFSSTQSFDLILLLNLIEHVAAPEEVLKAMRGLLSAGGLILIKTPNVDTLDCRIFRHRNWGGFHCPRHFVLFNRKSLTELGGRCGLRVRAASYTQGAPQWTASILGWFAAKRWAHISAERPLYLHPLYPYLCAATAALDLLRSPFMRTAQMFLVFELDGEADQAGAVSRTL
jgi:2-polyprenyl-3-methyl-5-hydroxy-6-metoxy-1,4-benzoquinol methylase